jgi:hypothetical protein
MDDHKLIAILENSISNLLSELGANNRKASLGKKITDLGKNSINKTQLKNLSEFVRVRNSVVHDLKSISSMVKNRDEFLQISLDCISELNILVNDFMIERHRNEIESRNSSFKSEYQQLSIMLKKTMGRSIDKGSDTKSVKTSAKRPATETTKGSAQATVKRIIQKREMLEELETAKKNYQLYESGGFNLRVGRESKEQAKLELEKAALKYYNLMKSLGRESHCEHVFVPCTACKKKTFIPKYVDFKVKCSTCGKSEHYSIFE